MIIKTPKENTKYPALKKY